MSFNINPALSEQLNSYVSSLYTIDCSLGHSPFGAPSSALDCLSQFNTTHISTYNDYSTSVELSVRLGQFLNMSPENIFLGNGSIGCLSSLFFKFFGQNNKKMLGVGPQFVSAVSEWVLSGGDYESVPLDLTAASGQPHLPIAALLAKIEHSSYTVLYLDNPNNPLGLIYSLDEIEQVVAACLRRDVFVIVDEAYGDYLPVEFSSVHLLEKYSNLIVVRSMAKGFGLAALRVGYMCVHDNLAEHMRKIQLPFSPTFISSKMACTVLNDVSFLHHNIEKVRHLKKLLVSAFEKNGITVLPTHSDVPIFTVFLDNTNLYNRLSEMAIVSENGIHFSTTREEFDGRYCRIRIPADEADICHIDYRLKNYHEQ